MSEKLSYNEAFAEIEEIISGIESGKYDIDELAAKVKRVSVLAGICREKLRAAEDEIKGILDQEKEK